VLLRKEKNGYSWIVMEEGWIEINERRGPAPAEIVGHIEMETSRRLCKIYFWPLLGSHHSTAEQARPGITKSWKLKSLF
jgi:hypothetical protein